MSVKSVKYLYKYVYKGHDCARIEFDKVYNHDEIKMFVDAKCVSATEATWILFEFRMHENHIPSLDFLFTYLEDRMFIFDQEKRNRQLHRPH